MKVNETLFFIKTSNMKLKQHKKIETCNFFFCFFQAFSVEMSHDVSVDSVFKKNPVVQDVLVPAV